MNKNYTKAINAIINLKKLFDSTGLNTPRGLVGEIGELYVLEKLQEEGFKVERKGGQGGYDIYIKGLNKKVEVKTSRLVSSRGAYPTGTKYWGWQIRSWTQKRDVNFNYLICVALIENFRNPRFYIFTRKEAMEHDDVKEIGYSNVKKAIHLFENRKTYDNAVKDKKSNKLSLAAGKKIDPLRKDFYNLSVTNLVSV